MDKLFSCRHNIICSWFSSYKLIIFSKIMDKCAIQKLFNPDTIYLAICTSGLTPFENASLRSKYWHDINFIQLKVKSENGYLKLSLWIRKKNPKTILLRSLHYARDHCVHIRTPNHLTCYSFQAPVCLQDGSWFIINLKPLSCLYFYNKMPTCFNDNMNIMAHT